MFNVVFKICRNTHKWWNEKAKPKIKENGADLIAVGLLLGGSLLMAASDPAITGIITALSIGTSIYFDYVHVKWKKELFDKKREQITLEVSAPSRNLELTKNVSTGISASFLLGYIVSFTLNSKLAEKSPGLQMLEYISTIFAVSSCHIGRKIYDSLVTRELHKLETESDEMLHVLRDNLGISNLAMLKKHTKEAENFKICYELLIERLQNFAENTKNTKTGNATEIAASLLHLLEQNQVVPQPPSPREKIRDTDNLSTLEPPQLAERGTGIMFFDRTSANTDSTTEQHSQFLLQ